MERGRGRFSVKSPIIKRSTMGAVFHLDIWNGSMYGMCGTSTYAKGSRFDLNFMKGGDRQSPFPIPG